MRTGMDDRFGHHEDQALVAVCLSCPAKRCRHGMCDRYRKAAQAASTRPGPSEILYRARGKTQSLRQWSAETGIPMSALRHRLRRGHTMAEALEMKYQPQGELHEAFGQWHRIEEWATLYGMGVTTLRSRLRYGMPLEEALTRPVRKRDNAKKEETV